MASTIKGASVGGRSEGRVSMHPRREEGKNNRVGLSIDLSPSFTIPAGPFLRRGPVMGAETRAEVKAIHRWLMAFSTFHGSRR